jgi:protein gp37
MNKTKIEWADSTWNPVTGCLNGCEYCYARGIANRFGKFESSNFCKMEDLENGKFVELYAKPENPYPYLFYPTFHRYRLNEYAGKTGRTLFVGSMTDLFGDFIPDEWLGDVFNACEAAPQHRYLFLTKNPKRYVQLEQNNRLPVGRTHFYGSTVTTSDDLMFTSNFLNTFLSIEPIMGDFKGAFGGIDWVIIGAETGNRKNKVVPKREWVEKIVEECWGRDIPVFMKNSLADVWGEPLVRQFPWKEQI